MYSLYFHIPFCIRRCAYCDFNTYAGQSTRIPDYVEALRREIKSAAFFQHDKLPVHTIYFGGGTPSLFPAKYFDILLSEIENNFELRNPEISLEANPGTLSLVYLEDLHALGFNRISLGVQSANPDELHFLERIHNYFDVLHSIEWILRSGFENFSVDLLFSIPGQTLKTWQRTLSQVTGLSPNHLSVYSLTIEPNTLLGRWSQKGMISVPDTDLAADMYEWAAGYLSDNGYQQYEISNWSRPGFQCRHNLQYWRNLPYLGMGAGAHGYAFGMRYSNALRINEYINRINNAQLPERYQMEENLLSGNPSHAFPASVHRIHISRKTEMQETMMVGLRLTREGVSAQGFHERFGMEMDQAFGYEIEKLINLGLLEWKKSSGTPVTGRNTYPDKRQSDSSLVLTQRGRMVGNQVFQYFVGD